MGIQTIRRAEEERGEGADSGGCRQEANCGSCSREVRVEAKKREV